MGCVSSKLFRKELEKEKNIRALNNGDGCPNHVVSLTSTTYGVLNLEKRQQQKPAIEERVVVAKESAGNSNGGEKVEKVLQRSPPREKPEVINAWELMEGLEEEAEASVPAPAPAAAKKSPKARGILLKGFGDIDARSPFKFLNQIGSPRKAKSVGGKENRNPRAIGPNRKPEYFTPNNSALRARNSGGESNRKAVLSLNFGGGSRRESFGTPIISSPVFDPELVASYEKELSLEGEEIKRMVSPAKKNFPKPSPALARFEEKCPPGGENAVVIYTTTLRGIRKTFEDCNKARAAVESHLVRVVERDVSMDSGYREELRRLMGTKEVRVPMVFVRGRLLGGAEEVVRLEEEGKLGILLDGIPRAFAGGCRGCAGFRFVMCVRCNGSCKVLDEQQKKMLRCGECNENGLVHCPICC